MKKIEDIYPLSPMQQGILFHSLYTQDPGVYFEQVCATIHGRLDVAKFRHAWQSVVDRHDVLRSAIVWEGLAKPLQVVRPSVTLPWTDLDWRAEPASTHADRLAQFLEADRRRGFDFRNAPLMRCAMIRLNADTHCFVWSHHHILLDGWCLSILVREAFAIYAASLAGRPATLPASRPYRDYIEWLAHHDAAASRAYWTETLAGFESPTPLRVDSRAGVTRSPTGVCREWIHALPVALSERLRQVARSHRITLNTLVQGAWGILLSRYSGERDIVYGATTAGRPADLTGVEDMVGLFVNTLPVRIRFDADPTTADWLVTLQHHQTVREAHGATPLVDIQRWSGLPGGVSLFDTVLAFENYPLATLPDDETGLTIRDVSVAIEETNYPLVVQVHPETRMSFRFLFDAGRFDQPTIAAMGRHLETLLIAMADGMTQPISSLCLLPRSDLDRLQTQWRQPLPEYAAASDTVPARFAAMAAGDPAAVAVVAGDDAMTYGELNDAANRLARKLISLGVGPDRLVGLCAGRTPRLIAGMLAILKAGGAYVPIDPETPRARRQLIIDDAQVTVMLADRSQAADLRSQPGVTTVDLEDAAWWSGSSVDAPDAGVVADNLAYVIYTSGSTGVPKGSLITHRNVMRLFNATQAWFQFNAADVWTMFHSYAFDFSVWEIWGALLTGGRLVIVPYVTSRSPEEFRRLLAGQSVTVLNQTPSAFRQLMDADQRLGGDGRDLALRTVIFGGEALDFAMLRPWFEKYGEIMPRLVNMYGITETTVHVTWRPVAMADCRPGAPSLIGQPIPDLRLAVLDWCGRPLPDGVPGELYVGGAGVARGYLNRPDLSAGRFVTCPLTQDPDQRVYRSGDRARVLPATGDLEYLGRLDDQVQIRGFRIEPGEIEAVLRDHPAVRECVVLADTASAGSTESGNGRADRLLAYVVPRRVAGGNAPASGDARSRDDDPGDADMAAHAGNAELVGQWRHVFDNNYGQPDSEAEATLNLAGWISSYTGEPIPRSEMLEWIDETVRRIRTLHAPQRVLEIGCGTGLLLARLAPDCRQYVGADFSASALASVERLRQTVPGLNHVTLIECAANDFSRIPDHRYDLVILNSVVQYFPGIDYLESVIQGALEIMAEGGMLFVGDVRHLGLLKTAHTAFERYQAGPDQTLRELARRVARRMAAEDELVIDPAYFETLGQRHRRIGRAGVMIKRGQFHNELTRFRYDAVVTVGASDSDPGADVAWTAWPGDAGNMDWFRERLRDHTDGCIGVSDIPDRRMIGDVLLARRMDEAVAASPVTLDSLVAEADARATAAIDPETLCRFAESQGYGVIPRPARKIGCFDILLSRDPAPGLATCRPAGSPHDPSLPAVPSISALATHPKRQTEARRLTPLIRDYLRQRLPAHMLPSAIIMLDAFPLGPTGKINRNALPRAVDSDDGVGDEPDPSSPRIPLNATEELLATIWSDVLGTTVRHRDTNFFDCGGHSLMATQVIAKARAVFEIDLPLRAIFDAPTLGGLAGHIDRARSDRQASPPPISPLPPAAVRPLSFAQQRLWFLDRMEHGSPMYNMPGAFRIQGPLGYAALTHAVNAVVRRHAILRTRFTSRDGIPCQTIDDQVTINVPLTDLSDRPDNERETRWRQMAADDAAEPFDLQRGPLLRIRLIKLDARTHVAVLIMHHIVSDGWSMGILIHELSTLYTGYAAESPSDAALGLPDLSIQYADFAAWQREWLADGELDRQTRYWTRQLANAPTLLELPTDRPRGAMQTFRGGLMAFHLDAALSAQLNALSRREGGTLYMTLMAGFGALMARLSGQSDVVVGMPIANRNHDAIQSLIGFFVNTLACRIDVGDHPSTRDLLRRVRRTALDAYAHQDLPFERLVEELQPERNLAHTPVFQVMLVMQNTPPPRTPLPDLRITPLRIEQKTTKFDLTFSLEESATGIQGDIEFNRDLFDKATIHRLARYYRNLLTAMVADPRRPVTALPMLDAAEREQIVTEWNRSRSPDADVEPVLTRFERQAHSRPDAVAIVAPGGTMTYPALNRSANRLARLLRDRNVGGESPVGICMRPSADMIVAVLAVLKAGGIYVPLDPEYPPARLARLIVDTGIRRILTHDAAAAVFESPDRWRTAMRDACDPADAGPRPTIECLSVTSRADAVSFFDLIGASETRRRTDEPVVIACPSEDSDLTLGTDPDQAAYIIFTSGSTGIPKGVVVPHRGLSNLTDNLIREFGLTPQSRCLQFAAFGFDVAQADIFMTLCAGAALCLPEAWATVPGRALTETLRREAITHAQLPASVIAVTDPDRLPDLQVVVVGGEVANAGAMARWSSGRRLVNAYGPSEATVCATLEPFDDRRQPNLIGRPLDGVRMYILDPVGLEPVPIGVTGDLFIGGVGVARGYIRRPAMTADAFLPDPFDDRPGARMYRTGDLARYQADGRIEFVGRRDHQIKLRGFRIEPGEIEAALQRYPAVGQAVVVVRAGASGNPTLIAFIVLASAVDAVNTQMRDFLATTLPAPMIPSDYVVIDEFPLAETGKIDRAALLGIERPDDQAHPGAAVPPRTPTETTLKAIWTKVLDRDDFGIHDNFFDTGGHSLTATQVVSQIRDQLQRDIEVRDVFMKPTIAELADLLDSTIAQAVPETQAIPIRRRSRKA